MDIISRLNRYLDTKNISSTRFADLCDIPRPSASQLLNGRNKKVSNEILEKIHSSFPDLSMQWLIFGEGNPHAPLIGFSSTSAPGTTTNASPTTTIETNPIQYQTRTVSAPTIIPTSVADRPAFASISAEEHNTPTSSYQHDERLKPEPSLEQRPKEPQHVPTAKQPNTQHGNPTRPKTGLTSGEITQEEENSPYYRAIKNTDSKSVTSIIVVYSDGTTTTFVPK